MNIISKVSWNNLMGVFSLTVKSLQIEKTSAQTSVDVLKVDALALQKHIGGDSVSKLVGWTFPNKFDNPKLSLKMLLREINPPKSSSAAILEEIAKSLALFDLPYLVGFPENDVVLLLEEVLGNPRKLHRLCLQVSDFTGWRTKIHPSSGNRNQMTLVGHRRKQDFFLFPRHINPIVYC